MLQIRRFLKILMTMICMTALIPSHRTLYSVFQINLIIGRKSSKSGIAQKLKGIDMKALDRRWFRWDYEFPKLRPWRARTPFVHCDMKEPGIAITLTREIAARNSPTSLLLFELALEK